MVLMLSIWLWTHPLLLPLGLVSSSHMTPPGDWSCLQTDRGLLGLALLLSVWRSEDVVSSRLHLEIPWIVRLLWYSAFPSDAWLWALYCSLDNTSTDRLLCPAGIWILSIPSCWSVIRMWCCRTKHALSALADLEWRLLLRMKLPTTLSHLCDACVLTSWTCLVSQCSDMLRPILRSKHPSEFLVRLLDPLISLTCHSSLLSSLSTKLILVCMSDWGLAWSRNCFDPLSGSLSVPFADSCSAREPAEQLELPPPVFPLHWPLVWLLPWICTSVSCMPGLFSPVFPGAMTVPSGQSLECNPCILSSELGRELTSRNWWPTLCVPGALLLALHVTLLSPCLDVTPKGRRSKWSSSGPSSAALPSPVSVVLWNSWELDLIRRAKLTTGRSFLSTERLEISCLPCVQVLSNKHFSGRSCTSSLPSEWDLGQLADPPTWSVRMGERRSLLSGLW